MYFFAVRDPGSEYLRYPWDTRYTWIEAGFLHNVVHAQLQPCFRSGGSFSKLSLAHTYLSL
jgi:hypothetical protein